MVVSECVWNRQWIDCLNAFSGFLGQDEITWRNNGCPILDYCLSARRKPVVHQMTDQPPLALLECPMDSGTHLPRDGYTTACPSTWAKGQGGGLPLFGGIAQPPEARD